MRFSHIFFYLLYILLKFRNTFVRFFHAVPIHHTKTELTLFSLLLTLFLIFYFLTDSTLSICWDFLENILFFLIYKINQIWHEITQADHRIPFLDPCKHIGTDTLIPPKNTVIKIRVCFPKRFVNMEGEKTINQIAFIWSLLKISIVGTFLKRTKKIDIFLRIISIFSILSILNIFFFC